MLCLWNMFVDLACFMKLFNLGLLDMLWLQSNMKHCDFTLLWSPKNWSAFGALGLDIVYPAGLLGIPNMIHSSGQNSQHLPTVLMFHCFSSFRSFSFLGVSALPKKKEHHGYGILRMLRFILDCANAWTWRDWPSQRLKWSWHEVKEKTWKRPHNSPSSFAHVFVVYDESYVIKQLVVDSGKRLICNLRWTIDGPHASASPISIEPRENCLLRARRKMLQDSICWKGLGSDFKLVRQIFQLFWWMWLNPSIAKYPLAQPLELFIT